MGKNILQNYSSLWKKGKGKWTDDMYEMYRKRYKSPISSDLDIVPPEDVMSIMGYEYTNEQFEHLHTTLPSPETLKKLRDDCWMIVAGPPKPLSLHEVLSHDRFFINPDGYILPYGCVVSEQDELKVQSTNERPLTTSWIAVRKYPLPGSFKKQWEEQQAFLQEDDLAPTATEIVWAIKLFFAQKRVRSGIQVTSPFLMSKYIYSDYTLTSTIIDGRRVVIGAANEGGAQVHPVRFTIKTLPLDFNTADKSVWFRHHIGLCPVKLF